MTFSAPSSSTREKRVLVIQSDARVGFTSVLHPVLPENKIIMPGSTAPVEIVPHTKKSGTDIFGHSNGPKGEHRPYVVRSDLCYYLEAPSGEDEKFEVQRMHATFGGGEHYFGAGRREFVIKGDKCCSTSSLKTNSDIKKFQLAANCKNGDHYCGVGEKGFAIITISTDPKQSKVLVVKDLKEGSVKEDLKLHEDYQDGIYFWYSEGIESDEVEPESTTSKGGATSKKKVQESVTTAKKGSDTGKKSEAGTYFVAKQVTKWGFHYVTTTCLSKPMDKKRSFPTHITKFIPGGAAFLMGPVTGNWYFIDSIDNKEGDGDVQYKQEMSLKIGHVRAASNIVEKNWKISEEVTNRLGVQLIYAQIKCSKEHGGKSADTSKEDWTDEHAVKKEISGTVPRGKVLYLWQYTFDMGGLTLLSTCHFKNTNGAKPTEEPKFISDLK